MTGLIFIAARAAALIAAGVLVAEGVKWVWDNAYPVVALAVTVLVAGVIIMGITQPEDQPEDRP